MSTSELYHQAPCSVFQTSGDLAIVLRRDGDATAVVKIDRLAARILRACQGAKPLEAHAAAVWSSGFSRDVSAITEAMTSLVLNRLLTPWRTSASEQTAEACAQLERTELCAVAIVTADRPVALRRCLDALTRHCEQFSRPCRVMVIDGSRVRGAETKAVVLECSSDVEINYVGPDEAAALRSQLKAKGLADDMLEQGLSPGAIGSNRNIAALLTAGQPVLMIDDDVIIDPWATEDQRPGIVVGGHTELREWEFFASRENALSALNHVDVDIIDAHSRLIGRTLSTLVTDASEVDLGNACKHLTGALANSTDLVVRNTIAGLAGDSGRYCPHALLFISGTARQRLMVNHEVFETALSSREIHHIARQTIVTHDHSACASYCMAIDNRVVLPPFMPIGRGEDTVFGAMLAFIDHGALFAHLPYGIVHDSDRTSSHDGDRMPSARETRISGVLLSFVASLQRFGGAPEERLRWLGSTIAELGELPVDDFVDIMGDIVLGARSQQLAALEAMIAVRELPESWRGACERYRASFLAHVTGPKFLIPIEFHRSGSVDEAFRRCQRFLRDFGRLIACWPDLWRAARAC